MHNSEMIAIMTVCIFGDTWAEWICCINALLVYDVQTRMAFDTRDNYLHKVKISVVIYKAMAA